MASTRTIPQNTYAPGTYGPFELNGLPGNAEGFRITMTRVEWTDQPIGTDYVTLIVEWRQTQQSPWEQIRRTTFGGGRQPCWLEQTWPGEWNGDVRTKLRGSDVRVSAVVYHTLTTAVTIEAI